MSVYTVVAPPALDAWLGRYDIGAARALRPIAEGVENTNYFLDTVESRYVLTLFERLDPATLPFYLGLMRTLADAGVPCPQPVRARDGTLFSNLCGKPAAIVTCLTGRPVASPDVAHCQAIGKWLGQMHLALAGWGKPIPNPCGEDWRRLTVEAVRAFIGAADQALLTDALSRFIPEGLPRGIVHADLFRDNALWIDGLDLGLPVLTGVIDFYFAGEDVWLFDLAVVANDWCLDPEGMALDTVKCRALLVGYHAVRPLLPSEAAAWPTLLVIAALRFWLSRLNDLYLPRPGALVKVKDPGEYRAVLLNRLANSADAPWLP